MYAEASKENDQEMRKRCKVKSTFFQTSKVSIKYEFWIVNTTFIIQRRKDIAKIKEFLISSLTISSPEKGKWHLRYVNRKQNFCTMWNKWFLAFDILDKIPES